MVKANSIEVSNEIVFRQATPDDVVSICSMLHSVYGVCSPVEYHSWRLFNEVVPSVTMAAFHENELIGTSSVFHNTLANGAVCGHLSYLNVNQNWRGRGCFTKLSRLAIDCFNDIDVLYVFANSSAIYPCEHSLGFKIVGNTTTMMIEPAKANIKSDPDAVCELIDLHTLYPVATNDSDRIRFKYGQAYRTWRYALNPSNKYFMVSLDTGEFAIIKKFIDPMTKATFGDIVDFECSLKDEGRLKKLFQAACWYLRDLDVGKITTWAAEGTLLNEVVCAIGFKKGDYKKYFGVKVLKAQYEFLYDFSLWHLRQVDATHY